MLLALISYLIVKLTSINPHKTSYLKTKTHSYFKNILEQFKYNALIRFSLESYLIVILCALMNLDVVNFDNISEGISSLTAIFMFMSYIGMSLWSIIFLIKNANKL